MVIDRDRGGSGADVAGTLALPFGAGNTKAVGVRAPGGDSGTKGSPTPPRLGGVVRPVGSWPGGVAGACAVAVRRGRTAMA